MYVQNKATKLFQVIYFIIDFQKHKKDKKKKSKKSKKRKKKKYSSSSSSSDSSSSSEDEWVDKSGMCVPVVHRECTSSQ